MPESPLLYQEVIKSFFLAFKRLSLYSVEHPLSREILNNLFKIFDAILKEKSDIVMAIGVNADEMLINENAVYSDTLGADEIYARFKGFKLDGVVFSQGLTLPELTDFVKALAMASGVDAGKPLPMPKLLVSGSEHIKIRKIRYEKVAQDQKVVSRDAAGGTGSGVSGAEGEGAGIRVKADVFADIKEFLTGKAPGMGIDGAGVLEVLDRDVSYVSDAIIQSAKESGDFEGVIKKFINWLSKHVTPLLIERKKDPGKFIRKLFDSFKKEELGAFNVDVNTLIEGCADDIKMAMIEDVYVQQKDSPKKALNLAAKILSDDEDQARILPKLVGRFTGRGVPQEEAHSFVKKVETELAKDEEVLISKKKLAKLTKLADRFEEELDRKVKMSTEELTELNKRLSDEKERTEGVMRYIAEGLVVVDNAGKVVMMNPAAEKLLGRGMKETLGISLAESLKDEHLLAVAKGSLDEKDEARITKEIELTSKDEVTKKILRASSAVVENENGKTVGMVSVLSDITHEKQIEEMKSSFVSLVTHELRTPVVAIQKSLELILSKATGEINEDQERFLSISKFNLERLNRLINDLLDMSKLEAGKLLLKPANFDFRDVVNEVKNSLLSWANDKKINIRLDFKDEPANVYADRDRMIQVMINLVGNALKFTPNKGEVSIGLNLLDRKDGVMSEPCLEVCVIDSGIGIDPKDLKRIFNKFEQVSLVSQPGVGGTGLGLPIAKEIITLHKGQIWAESQMGKGSKFIFVIPRGPGDKNGA